MKKVFCLMLITLLCSTFFSCSEEDDPSGDSELVGTWKYLNAYYVFNSDGTGYDYLEINGSKGGYYFTWKLGTNMLHLTYDGTGFNTSGYHTKGTITLYYTLEDDVLSLWYADDGLFHGAYMKQ